MRSIGGLIYLVIGLLIAWKKHYFGDINGIGEFVNLLLVVLLWPLVLFGVKFNLHFGGGGDKGKGVIPFIPIYMRKMFDRAA